jgi:hypothetical protein
MVIGWKAMADQTVFRIDLVDYRNTHPIEVFNLAICYVFAKVQYCSCIVLTLCVVGWSAEHVPKKQYPTGIPVYHGPYVYGSVPERCRLIIVICLPPCEAFRDVSHAYNEGFRRCFVFLCTCCEWWKCTCLDRRIGKIERAIYRLILFPPRDAGCNPSKQDRESWVNAAYSVEWRYLKASRVSVAGKLIDPIRAHLVCLTDCRTPVHMFER